MLVSINLASFSLTQCQTEHLFSGTDTVWGAEGNFWLRNKTAKNPLRHIASLHTKQTQTFLGAIEGNFIIFTIDAKKKRLELFSDISASIPLFYKISDSRFMCSTDLSVFEAEGKAEDKKAVREFYRHHYIPAPYTIFNGVKKIRPGYSVFQHKTNSIKHIPYAPGKCCDILSSVGAMKRNIAQYCRGKRVNVLATGGLDSSLLVYLAKELKPTLYFAAASERSMRGYNRHSIQQSRRLAKLFNLPLRVIPIQKNEYLKGFVRMLKAMDEPRLDWDLAGLYALFAKMKRPTKPSCILSGLSANELFNLSAAALQEFLFKKIPSEMHDHKKIARLFGLDFYAPYINAHLINYAFATPLRKRADKAPLKRALLRKNILPGEYITQPSLHTDVPGTFLTTLQKTLLTLTLRQTRRGPPAETPFAAYVLDAWRTYHLR